MLKEFKKYLKSYRKSAKQFHKEIKKNKELDFIDRSFKSDVCQYMCGYYYGLINFNSSLYEPHYNNVYGLCSVLNNLMNHQSDQNPYDCFNTLDSVFFVQCIDSQLLDLIDELQLNEFIDKANEIFNQLVLAINQTQTIPFDDLLLYENIITWTIYLMVNDKLENEDIKDEAIVNSWTKALTLLTSFLTEQLKKLLTFNFEFILEYINNIVLYLH